KMRHPLIGPSSWLLVLLLPLLIQSQQHNLFRRFEYKHSFRAPNLAQRDGSIPFWTVAGDAIASGEQLRLAPSMRSRKGIAWNKRAMTESENFELEVSLKITGQGRIGADGLAIWFTSQPGTIGPVFGANDYWTGMGLFLDSFDNDGQKNNPIVALMMNDGTRSYDHHTDGSQQILSSCQKDFRNKPFPSRIKIEYSRNVLTVSIDDGMTATPRYQLCMRSENIFLPRNGYFGISAATGGLADDHDVVDFSVYSLHSDAPRPGTSQQLPQEEKQKYDAEFEKQMHEYESERQKFKEAHPDKAKEDEMDDPLKYFEDSTARELRLIYEAQNGIHQVMKSMDERLREMQNVQRSGVQPVQHVQTGGGVAGVPSFAVHEKNEVMQTLRDMSSSLKDMKSYVNEIFTKTYNLEQRWGQGTTNQGGGTAVPDSAAHQKLDNLLNELRTVRANQINQGGSTVDSSSSSCGISSSFFITIILLQGIVILAFIFVRTKQDKAKFY
ncbi:ile-1, partial [Pristionchus pacificus]